MEISDQLLCLFSAAVEERDGSYVVEIPKQELQHGTVREGETYRVAMVDATRETASEGGGPEESGLPEPPVEEGERRVVEVEDIGEQGDGIARVERGYVVIVPDTSVGERVMIEISDVQQNVAFAEVVERRADFDAAPE